MDAKRISLVSGAALFALTATASAGPIIFANSYYGSDAYYGAPYEYYSHLYYGGRRYDWLGAYTNRGIIHIGGTSHRG
jgi:hypothetical protein